MNDFRGQQAWFSYSVPKECKQVWLNIGGKIVTDIQSANYIFADDASAPDISRFYKSKLFLDEGIQPFKSAWLLQTNKNIYDCILYPKDFKETVFSEKWAFVDEEPSSTFNRLKTFTNGYSQDSENTVYLDDDDVDDNDVDDVDDDDDMVSSPPNQKELKNPPIDNTDKGCQDLVKEAKSPIPVQNAHAFEKDSIMCQLANTCSVMIPSQKNPQTVSARKEQASLPQHQNSGSRQDEDEESTIHSCAPRNKTDSSSVTFIAEETNATMLLPPSVSLDDLEIPNHVFHSSMHDGFTHIEDIEMPDGLKLQDFFTEEEEADSEYQVFLKDPPSMIPHQT